MRLPPASLPAAASVPISASSSVPYKAGDSTRAAARQMSGTSPTSPASRPTAAGFLRAKEDPAKASAPGETETADESAGDSTPGQAFADIIRQLSSEASAPVTQSPATNANQGLFRGWQVAGSGSTPAVPVATAPVTLVTAASPPPVPEKKKPTGSAPRSAETPLAVPKDHTQDVRPVPTDVVTPFMHVKPKLVELTSAGGVSEPELKPRAVHAASLKPEAALTVVIRNDDPAAPPAAAKTAEYSGDQTEFAASTTTPISGSETPPVSASAQPDSTAPTTNTAQVAIYEIVAASGAPSPGTDTEHRKAGGGTGAVVPDVSAAKSAGPQTAAFQDLQLKGEPVKNDSPGPRSAAQTAPAAPPERVPPEKSAAPPVKSVALEFTPDGTRDVKVRLSERGGEVHVSVHSTDPTVTRSLRAGVTDLASVLEHAGYDAKAWAGDRQQQGNPQQQEQQSQQRRNGKSHDGPQQFDSILQQPNQENS